jgi:DUF4097 and DUF4098 domain-containing protein YvlB
MVLDPKTGKWEERIEMGAPIQPARVNSVAEIYIPKSYKGEINVSTLSGNIEFVSLFEGNKFGPINAESTSGNVKINKLSVAGDIGMSSTSGNIKAEELSANAVSLKSTSGNIEFDEISAAAVAMKTTSGDIEAGELTGDSVTAKSTSGDIELGEVSAKAVTMDTTSGDLEANRVTAENIDVGTSSGDVELGLPKEMSFTFNGQLGDGVRLDTYFDKALTVSLGYGGKQAMATVGANPRATVSVRSSSGEIDIEER